MVYKSGCNESWPKTSFISRVRNLYDVIPPVVVQAYLTPRAKSDEWSDYCCMECGTCRKKQREQEWLLPRIDGVPPARFQIPARVAPRRLQLIRAPGECVLGVLSNGYVVAGQGSVKRQKKIGA